MCVCLIKFRGLLLWDLSHKNCLQYYQSNRSLRSKYQDCSVCRNQLYSLVNCTQPLSSILFAYWLYLHSNLLLLSLWQQNSFQHKSKVTQSMRNKIGRLLHLGFQFQTGQLLLKTLSKHWLSMLNKICPAEKTLQIINHLYSSCSQCCL